MPKATGLIVARSPLPGAAHSTRAWRVFPAKTSNLAFPLPAVKRGSWIPRQIQTNSQRSASEV
ncbi:hypothetical protein ColTof3_09327 [Colletotrichum tofieldiae]|nr:hypothetical protein ColTof3_09327 [Colletotrichum tofieldiae]